MEHSNTQSAAVQSEHLPPPPLRAPVALEEGSQHALLRHAVDLLGELFWVNRGGGVFRLYLLLAEDRGVVGSRTSQSSHGR